MQEATSFFSLPHQQACQDRLVLSMIKDMDQTLLLTQIDALILVLGFSRFKFALVFNQLTPLLSGQPHIPRQLACHVFGHQKAVTVF
jgi:hypothetical protein